jgi:hypothetical protein
MKYDDIQSKPKRLRQENLGDMQGTSGDHQVTTAWDYPNAGAALLEAHPVCQI